MNTQGSDKEMHRAIASVSICLQAALSLPYASSCQFEILDFLGLNCVLQRSKASFSVVDKKNSSELHRPQGVIAGPGRVKHSAKVNRSQA